MPDDGGSPKSQPPRATARSLIVVARDQPDLWRALAEQFAGDAKVQVLRDRRRWERRQRVRTYEPDQRGVDRRLPPSSETDVRSRQFVIVRPRSEQS